MCVCMYVAKSACVCECAFLSPFLCVWLFVIDNLIAKFNRHIERTRCFIYYLDSKCGCFLDCLFFLLLWLNFVGNFSRMVVFGHYCCCCAVGGDDGDDGCGDADGRYVYSIIKHRGKCSRRYSKSSWDAPGQLVNSSSCKWRSWIMLDRPLDVSKGQPNFITWRTIQQKIETWERERGEKQTNKQMNKGTKYCESVKWNHS